MSQKEVAEIKELLIALNTTIHHIESDIREIKKGHVIDRKATADNSADLANLKGSYGVVKWLVLASIGAAISAFVKSFFIS